jgi:GAF domain-containing protein
MLETAAAWVATILVVAGITLLATFLAEQRRRNTDLHRPLVPRIVMSARRSDLERALNAIAESAVTSTKAGGAVVVLRSATTGANSAEALICSGRAGDGAPDLGTRLKAGSGFSGQCLLSGKLLHCDDSEIDGRVDREICRELGMRSIIAVPIRSAESVIGILEVFSPQPFSFTGADHATLRGLARSVATILDEHKQDGTPVLMKTGLWTGTKAS